MKITDVFYEDSKEIWQAYLQHPFIRGIGDGTLDQKKFEHYLIQDYLYLREYTKIFAMAMIKAEKMSDMQFFYRTAGSTMEDETAVHIQYLKRFGHKIEKLEEQQVDIVTENYTSYMQSICLKGNLKEIVAVVLPCIWSYSFIGQHLIKGKEQHFYSEWIKSYGGIDFVNISNQWIDYTNHLCSQLSEKERQKLSLIFKKASLHELYFWDMAYGLKRDGDDKG